MSIRHVALQIAFPLLAVGLLSGCGGGGGGGSTTTGDTAGAETTAAATPAATATAPATDKAGYVAQLNQVCARRKLALTPSRNGVRRAVREGAAVEQRAAYRSYARRYRAQTKELRAVAAPPNVTAQEELFATLDQIGDAYVVLGRQAGTKKGETATTAVYRLGLQRNDQAASLGAAACAGI